MPSRYSCQSKDAPFLIDDAYKIRYDTDVLNRDLGQFAGSVEEAQARYVSEERLLAGRKRLHLFAIW